MRGLILAAAVLLAACSDQQIANTSPSSGGFEVAQQRSVEMDAAGAAAPAPLEVVTEEAGETRAAPGFYMAYVYGLGLELPGERLAAVMDAHAQACTEAGPAVCQVISSSRDGDPDDFIEGRLNLRAQPDWLATFMAQAEESADEAGGEVRSRSTSAEDVTRQMVDTEARLTALRTLRDRLQEILRSRPGRVADLLEVERELARVQGELDATTSALAVLRQRVDMSELTITYLPAGQALTPRTFEPIETAVSGFLWMLSSAVGAIISVIAVALPWGLFLALVWWVLRQFGVGRGWRWPRGRRGRTDAEKVPFPSGEGPGVG